MVVMMVVDCSITQSQHDGLCLMNHYYGKATFSLHLYQVNSAGKQAQVDRTKHDTLDNQASTTLESTEPSMHDALVDQTKHEHH